MTQLEEKINELEEQLKKLKREATFVMPEYVKVLKGFFVEQDQEGKIYKTSEPFPTHLKCTEGYSWKETLFKNSRHFEPSTEEEYIEQNRIKSKYNVGDTIISDDESIFVVIKSIDNKKYSCYDEKRDQTIDYDMYIIDGAEYISKATDEKIIEVLKKHYKLEVGQEVGWGFRKNYYTIIGFRVRKSSDKNTTMFSLGKSRLVIEIDNYSLSWITPTIDNFIINAEQIKKIAGYKVSFEVEDEIRLLAVGCQRYTKDSLLLIMDIMDAQDLIAIEFQSTAAGTKVSFTLDQLSKLIDKFDK